MAGLGAAQGAQPVGASAARREPFLGQWGVELGRLSTATVTADSAWLTWPSRRPPQRAGPQELRDAP